jgi:hypothetical protein
MDQMIDRAIRRADIDDAVQNGQMRPHPDGDGRMIYVGRAATVILNENNWVVTVFRTGGRP